jgi:phage terminase large subunit-like protein
LKRTVRSHAEASSSSNVLIEDKASGTQLIQEMKRDGFHGVTGYCNSLDKVMRRAPSPVPSKMALYICPKK